MRDFQPTGLSPHTPPARATGTASASGNSSQGLGLPGTTNATATVYPIAGRPAPVRRPFSSRAMGAARSVRMTAADVSVRLNRSMRAAAEKVEELSAGAWCWVKIKTQWQFWLALAVLMTGWWLFAQHPANVALHQSQLAYETKYQEVAATQAQVNQLRQVYEPLRRGDPYAWQMLARHQLGWKQKSEVITVEHKPETTAPVMATAVAATPPAQTPPTPPATPPSTGRAAK